MAFAAYLGRSAGSAASVTGLYSGYHRARVSLGRVRQLLDLPQVRESPDAAARYGHDHVGESEVLEAARQSGVHEFDEELPEGYAARGGGGGAAATPSSY